MTLVRSLILALTTVSQVHAFSPNNMPYGPPPSCAKQSQPIVTTAESLTAPTPVAGNMVPKVTVFDKDPLSSIPAYTMTGGSGHHVQSSRTSIASWSLTFVKTMADNGSSHQPEWEKLATPLSVTWDKGFVDVVLREAGTPVAGSAGGMSRALDDPWTYDRAIAYSGNSHQPEWEREPLSLGQAWDKGYYSPRK